MPDIPKVIHYCWFGRKPLPPLALRCIASWRKHMPDHEIKEWNEDNFDVNMIPYTRQAYAARKYAFVSDVARFWILYHYGGVYFDTDVEVLKPLTPLLDRGPFMGVENMVSLSTDQLKVAPGLGMACEAGMPVIRQFMEMYNNLEFSMQENGKFMTVVDFVSRSLNRVGLKHVNEVQQVAGMTIYPADYFAARKTAVCNIPRTENSYTVHHYAGSWYPWHIKLKLKIARLLGTSLSKIVVSLKREVLRGPKS